MESRRDLVELTRVVDDMYDQNCYVLQRRDTDAVLVVDPGLQHHAVLQHLERRRLRCEQILLTHGHPDHVSGVPAVIAEHHCSAAIHPADRPMLAFAAMFPGIPQDLPEVVADSDLTPGQVLHWQGVDLQVLHTPGHSPGSVCFLIGSDLWSGDTLFRRSIGRSDLPGGSSQALLHSIEQVVYALPTDTVVFPGHGAGTTVGEEMEHNPFVMHPRYR